jgi:Mlc titration factor MtfA (ptsG expression regulator)
VFGGLSLLDRVWLACRRWLHDRTLRNRSIPDELWQLSIERYRFLAWRSDHDLTRLRDLAALFLDRKEFFGAHELIVTDEMAVAIAAQASLPILNLGLDFYEGFVGIVVHRDQVVARREEIDDDGIVHQFDEELSGEAMQGGPVMLSWHDVSAADESSAWGYNVTIHEFAHVIDMADGSANGTPPMPDHHARDHWQRVMGTAYESFCLSVQSRHPCRLDPYAAQSLEEFFAVTSESFFVNPLSLQSELPNVYALLKHYYGQDPAAFAGP